MRKKLVHFVVQFLRVHNLIVALLEFSIDLNILDIKSGKVLENFIGLPISNILNSLLINLLG